EAEGFRASGFTQHARIAHTGQMAVLYFFDTQQLGVEQHDFCFATVFATHGLRLEFGNQVVCQELCQLINCTTVPNILNRSKLLLGLSQECCSIKVARDIPGLVYWCGRHGINRSHRGLLGSRRSRLVPHGLLRIVLTTSATVGGTSLLHCRLRSTTTE